MKNKEEERGLIETLLNSLCSGYPENLIVLSIALYGLEHRWSFDKLSWYLLLVKEELKCMKKQEDC